MKPHQPEILSQRKKAQPLASNPPQNPKSATFHLKTPPSKQNHSGPTNDYTKTTQNHHRPITKIK